MPIILLVLGVLLIVWGGFVLVTGDFVATLDIAASLVASGVGVIAIGSVVAALNKIARLMEDRPQAQPAAPQQPAVQEQRRPQPAPAAVPPPPARPSIPEGPSVVREGDIEGHHYRFYSDGSIEAEGPSGARRYRSIEEAREQILRERNERDRPPAPAPVPRPRIGTPPPPPPAPPRTKPRDPADWDRLQPAHERAPDPYAPPGVKHADDNGPDDEEWSEPFRMLLRGEQDPAGVPPKQGKR